MKSRVYKLALAAGLSLAVASCDSVADSGNVTAPTPSAALVTDGSGNSFTLVEDRLSLSASDLNVSQLIGLDGGSLSIAGHAITVPSGAVSQPTLFTVRVVTSGYVQVDLTATVLGLLGPIDVGSQGFQRPVRLTLTYARSPNASNPSALKIGRLPESGGYEPIEPLQSTVNTTTQTVSADLEHFSGYVMISGREQE